MSRHPLLSCIALDPEFTKIWVDSLKAEMDLALVAVNNAMLREMYPIYFGPLTREDDAACMVRMLMNATGAYGDVYSECEDSESDSEEDEYW